MAFRLQLLLVLVGGAAGAGHKADWSAVCELETTRAAAEKAARSTKALRVALPQMPTLKLSKTLWGVDDAGDPTRWDALFARIKREGFSAVEAITLHGIARDACMSTALLTHSMRTRRTRATIRAATTKSNP